ncbi:RagB/SusD family nutrient uptake outer membrane protein [Marinifilum flexuosum]|uniref:SusD-like starch-binding protein associating with outer membrane n=1 Tax=Marinifilum flexuosum TaxID=1117708 RepID=A0A419X7T0_9BACT|nr:RagB/SusD family nutrient uptake outer membrane protein [Marinifilum flexuosum]RKE03791.1 SusD-like starch-binding protein associating with outer membrane [Marinifilum flexuosum]
MKKGLLYTLLGLSLLGASCSDSFLDEDPSNKLGVEGSIKTVIQAQYAIDGVYDQMSSQEYWGNNYISNFDVMADDMRASESGRLDDYYRYTFYTESSDAAMWTRPYRALKNAVSLLDVIDDVEAEGDDAIADKNDIKGQALALRALIHFDLVRTFGKPYTHGDAATALGVPIVTTKVNFDEKPARNTVEEVYTQVIKDFEDAIALLSSDPNTGRINKLAAKALLAKVYLYKGDMTNALAYAEEVLSEPAGAAIMAREDYVSEWGNPKMSEALFELVNSSEDNPGLESVGYLSDPDGYGQFVATDDFIKKLTDSEYDIRGKLLAEDELSTEDKPRMGRVMKYPGNGGPSYTTNIRIIRTSEVYLIAAEAALASDKNKAASYLNAIITRAYPKEDIIIKDEDTEEDIILFDYPSDVPTVTPASVDLASILYERSLELVAEGHRFHDLVRNNITIQRGDDYWGNSYKDIEMTDHKIIQPIPRIELDANTNMVQNPGYES